MLHRTLTLTIGIAATAMLLTLAPAPVAQAQLSIDPPLGCVQDSSGICNTGGCGACTGPTCAFSVGGNNFTLSTSVDTDLKCDGASTTCTNTGCNTPSDTLRARGKVTVTGSGDFDEIFIVCESIFNCDQPTIACGRCTDVNLTNLSPSTTMSQMSCADADAGSGNWQYVIWAHLWDDSGTCPNKCDQMDENACDPTDACNACAASSFGLAGSCCINL